MCHLYRLRINTHVVNQYHALSYRATLFTICKVYGANTQRIQKVQYQCMSLNTVQHKLSATSSYEDEVTNIDTSINELHCQMLSNLCRPYLLYVPSSITVYNLRIYLNSSIERVAQKLTHPDENQLAWIIFPLIFIS